MDVPNRIKAYRTIHHTSLVSMKFFDLAKIREIVATYAQANWSKVIRICSERTSQNENKVWSLLAESE
jgi:hypothetical protein